MNADTLLLAVGEPVFAMLLLAGPAAAGVAAVAPAVVWFCGGHQFEQPLTPLIDMVVTCCGVSMTCASHVPG
ncbi:MAG TPA: hypothetical protein VGI78_30960 [Acetobacteraceae bacterium]